MAVMNPLSLAEKLKELRTQAGLTQRDLAREVGITSGFVAQIETGDRIPSLDVLLRLATALQLKRTEQEELMTLYEHTQQEKLQRVVSIRTRGAAMRSAVLRTRGGPSGTNPPVVSGTGKTDADHIAHEIVADPDLLAAYQNLKTALTDPAMRQTVLQALEAFARAARAEPRE